MHAHSTNTHHSTTGAPTLPVASPIHASAQSSGSRVCHLAAKLPSVRLGCHSNRDIYSMKSMRNPCRRRAGPGPAAAPRCSNSCLTLPAVAPFGTCQLSLRVLRAPTRLALWQGGRCASVECGTVYGLCCTPLFFGRGHGRPTDAPHGVRPSLGIARQSNVRPAPLRGWHGRRTPGAFSGPSRISRTEPTGPGQGVTASPLSPGPGREHVSTIHRGTIQREAAHTAAQSSEGATQPHPTRCNTLPGDPLLAPSTPQQ